VRWIIDAWFLRSVDFFFFIIVSHWVVSLAMVLLNGLSALCKGKALLAGEVLIRILDV
jgi:hypothetical protein